MHSSDDDVGGRLPYTVWCRACGHALHTTAHGNRHRRLCIESHGFFCGCCGATFVWRSLIVHLNQPGAYRRRPRVLVPPVPVTELPDRPCSHLEAERHGHRYHPYARSSASSESSASGQRHHDPMWSGTAPAAAGLLTTVSTADTGFGYPVSFSPTALLTELNVTSPSTSATVWSDSVPSASWSTLGTDVTLTSAADTDDAPLSTRSVASTSATSSSGSNLPPGYTTDTPPLHSAAATIHSLNVPSLNQTDSEVAAVLVTQVIWLANIVRTHVRNLPPDDLADETGRQLMQARGQWLIQVPDPMDVPLDQLLRLLYPVWRHLLRRYSPQ